MIQNSINQQTKGGGITVIIVHYGQNRLVKAGAYSAPCVQIDCGVADGRRVRMTRRVVRTKIFGMIRRWLKNKNIKATIKFYVERRKTGR